MFLGGLEIRRGGSLGLVCEVSLHSEFSVLHCDVSWFEDGLPRIVERELVFKIPKAVKVT